jgi:septal ring factor EnvC (AmiA/AmiB activator)
MIGKDTPAWVSAVLVAVIAICTFAATYLSLNLNPIQKEVKELKVNFDTHCISDDKRFSKLETKFERNEKDVRDEIKEIRNDLSTIKEQNSAIITELKYLKEKR